MCVRACLFLSPLTPKNGNTPTANERTPLRNVFLMFSWCKNYTIAKLQESTAQSTLHGAGPNLWVGGWVGECVRVRAFVCMCVHAWAVCSVRFKFK